jgi:uncharacterized protein (TIGR03083 family)
MPRNVTGTYLAAADAAIGLIGDPLITARWEGASALAEFAVGGLAAHLARQVIMVPGMLRQEVPDDPEVIGVLDHYARAAWVDAALDDEANVSVRRTADTEAADGPAALLQRTTEAVEQLRTALPEQDPDRLIYIPWNRWALTLEDFLTTRLLEIVIHADDLAVSVGTEATMPAEAEDIVLVLLARLSVRRHGTAAVLRALSRKERAPVTITAF